MPVADLPTGPPPRHATLADTPLGPLTLAARGDRLTGVYMSGHRPSPAPACLGEPCPLSGEPFATAARELERYFAGDRSPFTVALAPHGSPFQRAVWAELRRIPYGTTVSYGELAARLGRPGAARAVGLANGRNPLSVVVPCHRVIGSTGRLTGYAGGLERKLWLLDLEGAPVAGAAGGRGR